MIDSISRAKSLLQQAEALLITAGAGMGVDSGLPDFRGTSGFWKAYPPYEKLGLQFMMVANPANFHDDPAFGWGFYGHRYNLYRATKPHEGFQILKRFGDSLPAGSFVYTSNVDGHFETAGFPQDQVVECHGSINHYQCLNNCRGKILPADWGPMEIDESTMKAVGNIPLCPDCGEIARPAILMFGDWEWNNQRTAAQEENYREWLSTLGEKRVAVIEMGAGTAIPTVRQQSEKIALEKNGFLIRINPRESEINSKIEAVSIDGGALASLSALFEP